MVAMRPGRPEDSFNAVRLLASVLVLWGHCYPLTGTRYDPLHRVIGLSAGQMAVDAFFVLSGFLIAGSLKRRASPWRYAAHRALRIFPGLWVMLGVTGLAYWMSVDLPSTVRSGELLAYFTQNAHLGSTRLDYTLEGWFNNNPYPAVVNGSLWTLPWEVRMYLMLAVVGFVLPAGWRIPASAAIALAGLAVHAVDHIAPALTQGWPGGDGWRFAGFYFAGAWCGFAGLQIRDRPIQVATCLVAWAAAALLSPATWSIAPYCLALPLVALWAAQQQPRGRWARQLSWKSDLSYGTYLYAFPVQQGLVATGAITSPVQLFTLAAPVVLGLAWLSWTLVEAPSLRLKAHLSA